MSTTVGTPFFAYCRGFFGWQAKTRGKATLRSGIGQVDGVADAVHAQRVGLARAAGRAARHDDDLVADRAPAELHQGRVDLVDALVRVVHRGRDERLDAPGQGQLAA